MAWRLASRCNYVPGRYPARSTMVLSISVGTSEHWSERRDSNPRPPVPQIRYFVMISMVNCLNSDDIDR
jgi:hypothetical protein